MKSNCSNLLSGGLYNHICRKKEKIGIKFLTKKLSIYSSAVWQNLLKLEFVRTKNNKKINVKHIG